MESTTSSAILTFQEGYVLPVVAGDRTFYLSVYNLNATYKGTISNNTYKYTLLIFQMQLDMQLNNIIILRTCRTMYM